MITESTTSKASTADPREHISDLSDEAADSDLEGGITPTDSASKNQAIPKKLSDTPTAGRTLSPGMYV